MLGPNLLCWTTNFFIKEANSPGFVSWHQDAFYWGLNKDTVMTAWVALTPANLKNGCMKFLPGSQTQDHLQHVDTFHKDNLLSRGQEIAVKVETENTVDCILNPGEMSLHHVKLVHGSEPNRSNDRRIGLAIRYIPTDVRQLKVRDSATLVRGVDREGNFDHEPRPRHDLDENALAAHADAVGRQVKALYSAPTSRSSGRRASKPWSNKLVPANFHALALSCLRPHCYYTPQGSPPRKAGSHLPGSRKRSDCPIGEETERC